MSDPKYVLGRFPTCIYKTHHGTILRWKKHYDHLNIIMQGMLYLDTHVSFSKIVQLLNKSSKISEPSL